MNCMKSIFLEPQLDLAESGYHVHMDKSQDEISTKEFESLEVLRVPIHLQETDEELI